MAGGMVVLLNAQFAHQNDIFTGYRVIVRHGRKETIVMVDLTNDMVRPGEVGLFYEAAKALGVRRRAQIEMELTSRPKSIEYIKAKMDGQALQPAQIGTIINEVMENRLSEGEMAAFMTSCYIHGMDDNEVVGLTEAIVHTGDTREGHQVDPPDFAHAGWPEGLLWAYYLSGDERLRDTAVGLADYVVRNMPPEGPYQSQPPFSMWNCSRQAGNRHRCSMECQDSQYSQGCD